MKGEATDPIVMEALEWFVRLRDEKSTTGDRRAFEIWHAQSANHAEAWTRAAEIWRRLDVVQPEFDRVRQSPTRLSRRNIVAGSLVLASGLAAVYIAQESGLLAEFKTGAGERKSLRLSDGSTVELGTYSALSTRFTGSERRVDLHQGEAFFDVATEGGRPFVVDAGPGSARALGTAFDVKFVEGQATVTVARHAVAVRSGAAGALRIEEGWQVSYDRAGLQQPRKADLASVAAWRRDRIVFEDTPLRRVLAELERYRRGRIILTSDRIGSIPVTAVFDTRQTEAALQTIAETLPIRIFHATGYVAFVYPAS